MKTVFAVILCLTAVININAQDGRYEKAMKKNISMIDSAKDISSMLDVANRFERIAIAEKDKWLPYYYTAFMYTLASFTDTTKEKTDSYLDRADDFINIADSLENNESEIYVLKGMIAQARMQVDPMNRWMKYGAVSTANLQEAMKLDTLNPRPEYLMGVSIYYTPEQFGGGPENAKPLLEKSLEKFNIFNPDDELMPSWGRKAVEQFLELINKAPKEKKEE